MCRVFYLSHTLHVHLCVSLQGDLGPKGEIGFNGTDGIPGTPGDPGKEVCTLAPHTRGRSPPRVHSVTLHCTICNCV